MVRLVPAIDLVDRRRASRLAADAAALRLLDCSRVTRIRRYAEDPRLASHRRYVGLGDGGALISVAAEGVPLRHVLAARGVLSLRAALVVFTQTLDGLAALHARRLVVRDHRPGRVLVGASGVVLTDVGLAALVDLPAPPYRAPELWNLRVSESTQGSDDPAADVYAATCVFVECLVGHPPYPGASLFTVAAGHRHAAPPTSRLPSLMWPLVAAGLAKAPTVRPTARTLAGEVRRAATTGYGTGWEKAGLAELAFLTDPFVEPARQVDRPAPQRAATRVRSPVAAGPSRPGHQRAAIR